jgi:hypothetical protein
MRIPVTVRNGSLVRGAGVALACLLPLRRRTGALVASYAAAWPVDRPGLQFVVVVPDEDDEPWKRAVLPVATATASWTVVMSLAVLGARRLPVSTPVAALLLGVGVAAGDSMLGGVGERLKAKAMAAAERAQEKVATADAESAQTDI